MSKHGYIYCSRCEAPHRIEGLDSGAIESYRASAVEEIFECGSLSPQRAFAGFLITKGSFSGSIVPVGGIPGEARQCSASVICPKGHFRIIGLENERLRSAITQTEPLELECVACHEHWIASDDDLKLWLWQSMI